MYNGTIKLLVYLSDPAMERKKCLWYYQATILSLRPCHVGDAARRRGGARAEATPQDRVLSVHFEWLRESKAVSSIVLGSTPEFEVALYSMCFLGGQEENFVSIAEYDLKIR